MQVIGHVVILIRYNQRLHFHIRNLFRKGSRRQKRRLYQFRLEGNFRGQDFVFLGLVDQIFVRNVLILLVAVCVFFLIALIGYSAVCGLLAVRAGILTAVAFGRPIA